MGAPLVGSPVQASVLTGGGIRFKGLLPKLQSKRLQMICEWRRLPIESQTASLKMYCCHSLPAALLATRCLPACLPADPPWRALACLLGCSPAQGRGAAGPGVLGGQEAAR